MFTLDGLAIAARGHTCRGDPLGDTTGPPGSRRHPPACPWGRPECWRTCTHPCVSSVSPYPLDGTWGSTEPGVTPYIWPQSCVEPCGASEISRAYCFAFGVLPHHASHSSLTPIAGAMLQRVPCCCQLREAFRTRSTGSARVRPHQHQPGNLSPLPHRTGEGLGGWRATQPAQSRSRRTCRHMS